MKYNMSGHPMEMPGAPRAIRLALRRVRRHCERRGAVLGRFEQIYGYETDLGPSWMASAIRFGVAYVIVHLPLGSDKKKKTAIDYCDICDRAAGDVYVVNFSGPIEFKNAMRRKLKGDKSNFKVSVLDKEDGQ